MRFTQMVLLFLIIVIYSSCKQSPTSPQTPKEVNKFVFPIDTGYTWTYKYYYQQLNPGGSLQHGDTTTYNGIHKWEIVSKQVMNDSTIYSVLCSKEDKVKLITTIVNDSGVNTSHDSVYTIKSEVTFPIIVAKDTVYCMWNKDPVIAAAKYLVTETKVPLNVVTPIDTLKYSSTADDYPFAYQVNYINGIGLYKIYASWYSMSVPQEGELDLISYNFK